MRRMRLVSAAVASIVVVLPSCTSASETPRASATAHSSLSSVRVLDLSECRDAPCEGQLEPGHYRATFYGRTLAFEISSPGWIWHSFYNFRLIADETPIEGLVTSDSINFLRDPRIATRDCEESEDRSVGHSVEELVS